MEIYEHSSITAPPYIELTLTQDSDKRYTPPNLAYLLEFTGIKKPDHIILKGAVFVSNYVCITMIKLCIIRKLFYGNIKL